MNCVRLLQQRLLQRRQRWLAPEVVQTSAMDCGPAALKCLLEGFHIAASYGRLREACQTSVDGTSIDTVETVARQLGLETEQVMLPRDYLWLPEARALPAMAVVRHPSGSAHFVVVWRRHGRWLQVMDPAVGRRWITCERFEDELFPHSVTVSAADWFAWATSEETRAIFVARLQSVGASATAALEVVRRSAATQNWQSLAALDAATRMLSSIIAAGGLPPGAQSLRLLESLVARSAQEMPGACVAIPAMYWPVVPTSDTDGELSLRGVVLLRIQGRVPAAPDDEVPLAPELVAALTEQPAHPLRELWNLVKADGLLAPLALLGAVGLAAGGLLIEALLFRGLFDLAQDLNVVSQRVTAFAALLLFVTLLWAFELPIVSEAQRLGRHLETRLRALLLQKLPTLSDRYFQSRPISDLAERSHSLYLTRQLPDLAIRFVRSGCELVLTLVGIACIDPRSLPTALAIAILTVALLGVAQPVVSERDMRVRTHAAALHVFFLDALLGIVPIRVHGAERSVRREHEALLSEWARSATSLLGMSLSVAGVQSLLCTSLVGWLLFRHLQTAGVSGDLLLLVYWVLKLPTLSESLTALAAQYPTQRNIALRLLELTKTPEETIPAPPSPAEQLPAAAVLPRTGPHLVRTPTAVAIELRNVAVVAAGHTILHDVDLNIRPGEHIAIVGSSGAGKSSLFGLLLGWHRPAAGAILTDGEVLIGQRLQQLHSETAWVDPAVQLWNRSLLENLRYSSQAGPASQLTQILVSADLANVLVRLPEGLQSPLAEGGVRLSGGEGQRVRLARAMWQQGVRLALLDEPFRGLDREQRQRHLTEVRRLWQHATLLCATHDVSETRSFDRVLVVDAGRIVEDGQPERLAATPNSHYRRLLEDEESLRQGLWNAPLWRRVRLEAGQVFESSPRVFERRERYGS